jgi:hypothetical protein
MRNLLPRRRARWAAPIAVAGAIALGSALTTVSAGATTPDLPALSTAQVLAKASHPDLQGFAGTVELAPDLGLPSLSEITSDGGQGVQTATGFDPTTLLTQSNAINVWDSGAGRQRLQLATSQLAETDLVHSGDQAWLWDSSTQQVTHFVAAAHSGTGDHASSDPSSAATDGVPTTPEQAAQKFLDHLDPSTSVTTMSPVYVAGRSAYQLSFSPKAGSAGAAASTVSAVTMTVDSATGTVLSFAVDAAGSKTPALSLAFTRFDPGVPGASTFDAPVGRTTKTEVVGGGGDGHAGGAEPATSSSGAAEPAVSGSPWAQVITIPDAHLSAKDMAELDKVSTAAGADRLVHTSVVNALVEPDGTVLVGFVQPSVLEATAAAG